MICSIENCDKQPFRRGMCSAHYSRLLRYGDPVAPLRKAKNGTLQKWVDYHKNYQGDDCLKWPFANNSFGYGVFAHHPKGPIASRVMCWEVYGDPPSLMHYAIHTCGNGTKGCVNPRHIRWGTPKENSADKLVHGTWNGGEKNGQAKLTPSQVAEIKTLVGKMSDTEIARMFGVTRTTILRIRTNVAWQTSSANQRAMGKVG